MKTSGSQLVVTRNISLDLFRLFGISIIMIAHANPPAWLFQLRNFGTPLLIVASALTYAEVYSNRYLATAKFYKKRMFKLIIPAWVFLSFFFLFWLTASNILSKEYPFTIITILSSYSFLTGIGFLWIFKVYIILALMTPLALKFSQSSYSNSRYFITLIIAYIIYELAIHYGNVYTSNNNPQSLLNTVVLIIVPYGILYLYGMRLHTFSNNKVMAIAVTSLLLFLFIGWQKHQTLGEFIPTQHFKYPPSAYYLSYALFALNCCYLFCRNIKINNIKFSQTVLWLSSNALWIYLWHVMAYYLWHFTISSNHAGFTLFIAKLSFLFLFGIICTYLQLFVVKKFVPNKSKLGVFIYRIFT